MKKLLLRKCVEEDLKYCIDNNAFISCNDVRTNKILNEDTYWISSLKWPHYRDHVCDPDKGQVYTGEVDESGIRIKFPKMSPSAYFSRAEGFTSNLNVGTSRSSFSNSTCYGWQTEFSWFRGRVCIKFRLSDLNGPRQDGLVEYVAYVLEHNDNKISDIHNGYSRSYYDVKDRKIISYGLCTRKDPLENFEVVEELPPTERKGYITKVIKKSVHDAIHELNIDECIDK